MKRLYYVSEVEDKLSVKVVKLNEDLNVMKNLKRVRVSIRNCFNTEEIHV